MQRLAVFVYGVVSYALFFGCFLYLAAWMGNLGVPRSLDAAPVGPLGQSLVIDLLLVALFGVQHSVMARPWFKRWWTRWVPTEMERSTYVLATNVALLLLFWQWRPLGGVVWALEAPWAQAAAYTVFAAGIVTVLVTTFLINHFDLFGLRQVWMHLRGREYRPLGFVTPGPYRLVRHPLYVGWLLAFWGTPTMTVSHLVFAVGMTAYILIAIVFEERDLAASHPEYAAYRARTPMLVPRVGRNAPVAPVPVGR